MNFHPAAAVRELDARAIREGLASGAVLMGRAARGLALRLRAMAEAAGWPRPRAWLFAGTGNNGGDASALAALLVRDGWRVDLWLAGTAGDLHGEALASWLEAITAGVTTKICPAESDWQPDGATAPVADVLVDGVLGTGIQGAPRGVAAAAIACLNRHAAEAAVVAIDLPSGLDADTGAAPGACVRADWTLTLGAPKAALAEPAALAWTGTVDFLPLGFPSDWLPAAAPDSPRLTRPVALPSRPRDAHKGRYGRLLIIAGSAGLSGAAALAARAASRSGAGLVSVLTPASLVSHTAALCPEAMVHPGPENREGGLAAEAWNAWQRSAEDFDAILVGPGMGRASDTLALLRKIFAGYTKPVVLDADAINCFEGRAHWMEKSAGPLIITPHAGELARVLGTDAAAIQADRPAAARQAVKVTGATVVLKGAGTLIAHPGEPGLDLNLTGNPGLAKGGSGDVLAGLLTGLLAQGLPPADACRTAVFVHGRAGDLAALRLGPAGMTAGDVLDALPLVLRDGQRR